MGSRAVFFIINLLQDVNILRSLLYLTARESDARLGLLVTEGFLGRDRRGIWAPEVAAMARDVGAHVTRVGSPDEAFAAMQGATGLIFAPSESNLSAHRDSHDILRIAPPGYLRVTLQHGFECVGFLQSREHNLSHGRNIRFAADVVCGWFEAPVLTALPATERSKLFVSGPPTLLQSAGHHPDHPAQDGGIICENLHSVRLTASGPHRMSFMGTFFDYCAALQAEGQSVTLRPHPGGQYMLNNNVSLPDNVVVNNLPMFHVNLKGYTYGISAPSTVVFDMVLAGLPVGVWRDSGGVMDAGNYTGLTEISGLDDWLDFQRDIALRPQKMLARQEAFLSRLAMPREPSDVYRRFARLLGAGLSAGAPVHTGSVQCQPEACAPPAPDPVRPEDAPKRILFMVNGPLPTLEIFFLRPLAHLFASGRIHHRILTQGDIETAHPGQARSREARDWLLQELTRYAPDIIVCCRYSGPHSAAVLQYGRKARVPVIYHIDDDLLNVPPGLGASKAKAHSDPKRIRSMTELLSQADLIYCSTPPMKERLRALNFYRPAIAGTVCGTAPVLRLAQDRPVRRIGYMGFHHDEDLALVVPALVPYLRDHPQVTFELFGSISVPEQLRGFGEQVQQIPPVYGYDAFLATLADRAWDIGICPLVRSPFNLVKSNTKWVEYTAAGMATIASKNTVYDICIGAHRGLLVEDDGWLAALQALTRDPSRRYRLALQAQAHLLHRYSGTRLRDQTLDVFQTAMEIVQHERQGRVLSRTPLAGLQRRMIATPTDLVDASR